MTKAKRVAAGAAAMAIMMAADRSAHAQALSAAKAQNEFGLRMLAELSGEQARTNVVISPASMFLALAALELGAAGETRQSIRSALGSPAETTEAALHESTAALGREIASHSGVELDFATAIWSDRSLILDPEFILRCREFYQAHAQPLDFGDEGAAGVINAWVSERSRGRIPSLVSQRAVAASTAVLTNAVIFKGKWKYPFLPNLTQDGGLESRDESRPVLRKCAVLNDSQGRRTGERPR